MDRTKENGEYPENYFATVDDRVYKLAELRAGQRTVISLAELAVTASEGEVNSEFALESIKSQTGTC